MGVRKRPLPVIRDKIVTATKRLPLWRLSDEMYLHRQLAPDPDASWMEIKRQQARMKDKVIEQQKRDMKSMERELCGFRLEPRYNISELRAGMWVDGRISGTSTFGVWVDIGAYTDRGEWIDAYLHAGQMREDGRYVMTGWKMMDEVYLGELVRVRVREVVPSTGTLKVSMRTVEDLPPLFLGQPRPYSFFDLQVGMKVTGIVRRAWHQWALVDIGADRICRIHVSQHPRQLTRYGFYKVGRRFLYAFRAFARGAQMDFYISKVDPANQIVMLSCLKPRLTQKDIFAIESRKGIDGLQRVPGNPERLTRAQTREKEKGMAEKAPYEPYVPQVDEWLEEAMEPDEETDSWVARTENELFGEMQREGTVPTNFDDFEEDEPEEEEDDDGDADGFADDEFAEDDFADNEFQTQARAEGFGPNAFAAKELDGWVLDDNQPNELAKRGDGLTEEQLEALFDAEDDEEPSSSGLRRGGGGGGGYEGRR